MTKEDNAAGFTVCFAPPGDRRASERPTFGLHSSRDLGGVRRVRKIMAKTSVLFVIPLLFQLGVPGKVSV